MSYLRSFLGCVVAGALFPLFAAGPAVAQSELPSHSVGMIPTEPLAPAVKAAARSSVRGTTGKKAAGEMGKVGLGLALLYHQYRQAGPAGVRALREEAVRALVPRAKARDDRRPRRQVRFPVSEDGRFVTVEAVAADEASRLLNDLRALGFEGAAAGGLVSGRLPISALRASAQLTSLQGMVPSYMRTHIGSVGSEADTAHATVEVRRELGVEGSGQKICALSDSYNQDGSAATTAEDDIQSGDLPGPGNPLGNTTPVDVLDDGVADGTDEGRAMLQLIHDIAPGAELGFHTAFKGVANFAEGIRELADSGCTVIVDDVGSGLEPFWQDGPITNAVDDVVESDGVTYFSSAGNDGNNSYQAPFRGSGQSGVLSDTTEAHDFDPSSGTDIRQRITVQPGGSFQVFTFQWTDPSAIVEGSAGADTDLDISLVNSDGDIESQSTLDSDSLGVPFESLSFTNESTSTALLDFVVERASGPAPDSIKYIYFGADYEIEEYDTKGPTIYGHPMAERAMAVAAAPFFNTAVYNTNVESAVLEQFSSKGGIPILFDQSGARLGTPIERQKPEVTGTDGVDNTFFGFDIELADPDPHPNFFGTSAAAPNIAAIAALIQQARPALSPTAVYDRLESTAADVVRRRSGDSFPRIAEGVDPWSGHGFVVGPEAVPEPAGVQIAQLAADSPTLTQTDGSVQLSWKQVGQETADVFVVKQKFFDGPFTERGRVQGGGGNQTFQSTVENLPVGEHTFRVEAVRNDSVLSAKTVQRTVRSETPRVVVYPNPFRGQVNLSVTLPPDRDPEQIRATVFDALGRRVSVPLEGRTIEGANSIALNVDRTGTLAAGVYFVRVRGDSFVETVKIVHAP